MRRIFVLSASITLALSLVACSGGGSIATPPRVPVTNPTSGSLSIQIEVPAAGTASSARRPAFVSPSTESVAASVNGGDPVAVDVGAGAAGCTAVTNAIECTIQLLPPIGSDTVVIKAYDKPNSGTSPDATFNHFVGTVLSSATLTTTIKAGANTILSSALGGVPASLLIAPLPGQAGVSGSSSTGYTISGKSAQFLVEALDADNDVIVGPGAPLLAPKNVPSGLTVTLNTGSQNVFTVGTSASVGALTLSFSATPVNNGTSVAPVVGGVSIVTPVGALLAVTTGEGLASSGGIGSSPTNRISVYSVANPATPTLLKTITLPACPAGSLEQASNGAFDTLGDLITGYACYPASGSVTGALLVYAYDNGAYSAAPVTLDGTSGGVGLVSVSGSTVDYVVASAGGSPPILAIATFTPPATFAQTATSPDAPFTDFELSSGKLFLTVGSFYEITVNAVNFSDIISYESTNGISGGATGVAIDANGNVWGTTSVPAGGVKNAVFEMTTGSGALIQTYTPSQVVNPAGIDFDINGNLWVVDGSTGTVYGFAPPSGASLGSPIGSFNVSGGYLLRASR